MAAPVPDPTPGRPKIVIVGGGYVGMYTALRLQRKLKPAEAHVTIVDPRSYMTYQPFLPEAAAGNIEARHVVVPLRRVLDKCDVVNAEVVAVDPRRRVVTARTDTAEVIELPYDHLVMAPGSVPRTLPIPGLADVGIGFKRVEEAIYLRNHVIDQLDLATSTHDKELRNRALAFVFIGGGYAGVEALAEIEDMAAFATRYYDDIEPTDLTFVLVEASRRILPEVSENMGRYTVHELRGRGIDVRLETRLESCVDGHVVLSDGAELDANTIVWTAGVKPHPLLGDSGLPLDERGRVRATAELTVVGMPGHWSAGDCAAVPDLSKEEPGATCGPSAQHAVRQAKRLGDNLVAALRGEPLQPYRHSYAGSVASLGLYKGVADVYGVKVRGIAAWFMHRTYHLSRIPTFNRKVRVLADWTEALFFRREVVSIGSITDPRKEFRSFAVRPKPQPAMSGPSGHGDSRGQ